MNALEQMWDQVPATIQHAVELVRRVGEEYIWVDRLCIVQDDYETKQEQISQMALIYGNAYFTIVATAAYSAEEGLRGIKDVSPSMYHNVWPERANMDHYGLVAWSPWNERGWTLQELAKRPFPAGHGWFCLDQKISVDLSPWASGFAYLAGSSSEQTDEGGRRTYTPLHVAYQQEWNSRWSRKRPPAGVLDGLVTESICSWYVKEETGERLISNDLDEFKYCCHHQSNELPMGWQRDGDLFYHPVDPQRRFKYPIPLVTNEDDISIEKDLSFLIKTQTERAFFFNTPEPYGQAISMLEGEAVVNLCNSEQVWVGCLRVQTRTILWRLLTKKVECELVAISKGYIDSNAGGWSRLDEHEALKSRELEGYEFYNVLFIELNDGIAYRQGIGRVDKTAWEGESRQVIDLVLG
ncbi:hypothetical protein NXS19_010691 [Fusarium pseudograminearum]|nr:hypothetical protein NXS19_010691 [Fusarium pseudograminearum]